MYFSMKESNNNTCIQWNLVSSKRKEPGFFLRTKRTTYQRCDCVRIFPLPYADLYDQIDVACLTAPSIWGLVPWMFSSVYGAMAQIQCSRYI